MAAAYASYGMTPGQVAEAPKKPHLYVGNLSPRVTDYMLTEIFAVAGTVVSAKIVQDRNFTHGGMNYGFVEYADMRAADQALQTLNGRKLFDTDIRVNWAYQGNANKEDTQHHFHVFVGDLSPEVNDEVLNKAFGAFGSLSEARVMWDMNSGKSRGYGFLSFRWAQRFLMILSMLTWQGTSGRRPGYRDNERRMARISSYPSQLGQPKDSNWSYAYRHWQTTSDWWRWRSTTQRNGISTTLHVPTTHAYPQPGCSPHDGSIQYRRYPHVSTSRRILFARPNPLV
jgi:hypothetical protein